MSLIEFLWPLIRLIIFAGLGIVAVCFLYSVFKVGCDNVRNRIDDYFSDQSKLNRKKDKYINKLQKRAKREDAEAQFELAQKLFLGIDFEKNDEWALYYYEKSAENGNRDAQSTMGSTAVPAQLGRYNQRIGQGTAKLTGCQSQCL